MSSFWSRKGKRKGGLPLPAASQAADLGVLIQERSPKPWVEDAVPQQPVLGDPEEERATFCWIRHPSKGGRLRRTLQVLWQMARAKDGNKRRWASRGAKESQRTTGMQVQATKRCTKLEEKALGLLEELGTGQKAPRGGEAQREEQVDLVTAVTIPSTVPHLGEEGWDEQTVGCEAQDGDVLRGGGGHGDEMSQTQPLVQAGAGGDEEGRFNGLSQSLELWVEDEEVASIRQGDGDGQDFKPPSAEGRSQDLQRKQVWEKLQYLGEDMARWEGRSTRELAVGLIEVILKRETEMYPIAMGNESNQQQQGQCGARARVDSSKEVHALGDITTMDITHAGITTMQQPPQLQSFAVYHDVPVFINEIMCGDDEHDSTVLEPFEDEQIWENSDDDLLEQGGPPDRCRPAAPAVHIMMLKEISRRRPWWMEFQGVWAQYETDCGRVSGEVKVSGQPVPFRAQPSLKPRVEDEVAELLTQLLADGVVERCYSSSNSPLKLTQMYDEKKCRLVLDCRDVNKATPVVVDPVKLDVIKLITAISPKSKFFSVVDLSNPSFAIPLEEGSRARFAFTFQGQQYRFTRLPQGFHSTTSIVHQWVEQMLSQLAQRDRPWVFSYVDDILITGKSQEETAARTRRVLQLIQKTGFKAKFEKAQLVQRKVDYLGKMIGPKGWKIEAKKLEAIRTVSHLADVPDVRSLLGRFGYFHHHIPNYWELAQPLHQLTTEGVNWKWGREQKQALKRLKHAALTAPPLRFPDKSQPFVIRLMTSKQTVGASLLQENEAGRLVPVGHKSRMLKGRTIHCSLEEKSCLAAVWATRVFEPLTGPAPILVQMPHSPGKYLLRGEALGSGRTDPHPLQCTLLLVNGGLTVEEPQAEWGEPSGCLVLSAPPLRQLPSDVPKANVWFMASQRVCSVGFAAANLEERWLLGVAESDSVLGAELEALWQLLSCHRCSSNLYLYTGCLSLVEKLVSQKGKWEREPGAGSSEALWPNILQWVHENPGMLHIRWVDDVEETEWNQKVGRRAREMGRAMGSRQVWEPSKHERQEIIAWCHGFLHDWEEGTLARVKQVASWEGDSSQVARWVQSCLTCAVSRSGVGRVLPQRADGPWSQLYLSYVKGLPKSTEGHCSLLVVEDEFSGWVEAFPMGEPILEEMARVLSSEVFARYGTPHTLRLPSVPPFLYCVTVMAAFGMEPPWNVLTSCQAGPATATLLQVAQDAGKEWVKMLPLILAGVRSLWARGAALSPYQITGSFPLEMRWTWKMGGSPRDNVLRWLSQLQADGIAAGARSKPC